eukprot:TRINITY_DN81366_c0_g1_i1.p1 TRINITY_DN81366_c0_g1~~TRINITY_DN81366_c0_g1_i1.p1  ORF type:complete len:444 (-),score=45.52 TRINITY_DN81366_c0_g1_i1:18-1298(-)
MSEDACDGTPMRVGRRCLPKPLMPRYISEAGAAKLPHFKYSGCDNSFLYRYFCSPLADALVRRCVPRWLAPNCITLLGLVPSVFGHCLVAYHCPTFREECPSWCWAVLAACTFIYQTLDNMDGKQARRIGLASPLGLLMDHGVDAVNITLGSLNLMALFQLGDSVALCLTIWLCGAFPFFFATWEEFYTGTLHLGIINGPTDGVLIVCGMLLLSAAVDDYAAFWEAPLLGSSIDLPMRLRRKDAAIAFFVISVVVTVLTHICTVTCLHWKARQVARKMSFPKQRPRLRDALGAAVPFCLGAGSATAWLTMSTSEAFQREPRLVFWLFGLIFSKLVTHLQLAHICGEHYRPWRKTFLLPLIIIAGNSVLGRCLGGASPVDEVLLLRGCVVFAFVAWLHAVVSIVVEMSTILRLSVLTVPRQKLIHKD